MTEIRFFARDRAQYPWLSNFFPAPIAEAGKVWPTAEHLYQACKTDVPGERERIRLTPTPGAAKRLGRIVTLRRGWLEERESWMAWVLQLKFRQHADLAARLVATGDSRLVEDSPWDSYWGIGRDGRGRNTLGVLLMELREAFRSGRVRPSTTRGVASIAEG